MMRKSLGHGRTRRRCALESSGTRPPLYSHASPPIRVLIADGQEVVRVGMRAMIEGEPDLMVVGEADTPSGTLSEATRVKPDIVLIESRFPDGSGIETCRLLLKSEPACRVIIMTQSGDASAFRAAVAAGAHGYALKDIGRGELLRAIRVVAGGASYLHSDMIEETLSALRKGLGGAREPGLRLLSPQEWRMIPLVAEGKTNKEIAAELALSEKTVKNYLSNMFAKLHITRRVQAAALYVRDLQHRDPSDVSPSS